MPPTLDDQIRESQRQAVTDEIRIQEKTELGEVMDNLDSDKIDPSSRMSSIDFNARLSGTEISSIMVIDELTRLGIFPESAGITRQKKRLSVSLNGKGRDEKVEVVRGERSNRSGGGMMEKFGNLFKPQQR